jgi:hypothetical protein
VSERPVTVADDSRKLASKRKTLLLNRKSLNKEQATLSTFLDSKKFVPGGVSGELLGHFEEEGEGLLWQTVTDDETWVH